MMVMKISERRSLMKISEKDLLWWMMVMKISERDDVRERKTPWLVQSVEGRYRQGKVQGCEGCEDVEGKYRKKDI